MYTIDNLLYSCDFVYDDETTRQYYVQFITDVKKVFAVLAEKQDVPADAVIMLCNDLQNIRKEVIDILGYKKLQIYNIYMFISDEQAETLELVDTDQISTTYMNKFLFNNKKSMTSFVYRAIQQDKMQPYNVSANIFFSSSVIDVFTMIDQTFLFLQRSNLSQAAGAQIMNEFVNVKLVNFILTI